MQSSWVDKASHSEVEAYLNCQRKHYYMYVNRLQAIQSSDSLARGNVGHEILSIYYQQRARGANHEDAADAAMDAMTTVTSRYNVFNPDKLWDDLEWMLVHYFDCYANDKFTVIETEVLHNVQITDDYIMPIKVDLVLDIPGRGIVARDWKFTYDFYTVDKVDLNPQLPKYFAALRELGIHVDELEYDQIRTRVTKANQANWQERFMRTVVPITADRVVRTMEEQFRAARRIAILKELPVDEVERRALRNSWACLGCPFTELCVSDLNGGQDSQLITESFFETRLASNHQEIVKITS